MAIYKNGKKIDGIYKNGKKIDKIYKNGNIIYGTSTVLEIKSFSEATDEEIAQYLDWHYSGKINIADYWNVGDTRLIHIDDMLKSEYNTIRHLAQDITIVIMDFEHDDLSTPINGKTKAAISIGFREVLGNSNDGDQEYYWGKSHYPVLDTDNYSLNPIRNWLNDGLLNAFPETFGNLIKEVDKKNLAYHTKTDDAPIITNDKIWFISYPEVFGNEKYKNYLNNQEPLDYEGYQYEYFKDINNRIKKENQKGSSSSVTIYWLRSPNNRTYAAYGYYWCIVSTNGNASDGYGGGKGYFISPAFCL